MLHELGWGVALYAFGMCWDTEDEDPDECTAHRCFWRSS